VLVVAVFFAHLFIQGLIAGHSTGSSGEGKGFFGRPPFAPFERAAEDLRSFATCPPRRPIAEKY
jgi:hypothetical protein